MKNRIGKIIITTLLTAGMLSQNVAAYELAGLNNSAKGKETTLTDNAGMDSGNEDAGPADKEAGLSLTRVRLTPEGDWMKQADFPDRLGRIDDTLAMNSMVSFMGYEGQGTLYLTVDEGVTGFTMYINENKVDTSGADEAGVYELDYSGVSVNGMNTVQITGVKPDDTKGKVHLMVPYPTVVEGTVVGSGINEEAFSLIEDIISSDIDNGFTSAQMTVIRHGRLVYENAWGKVNTYLPDGTVNTDSRDVTKDTLYDLASVTKMFAVNYALQKFVSDGEVRLDDRVSQYLGDRFAEDTLDFAYTDSGSPDEGVPDINTQKAWKSQLTIKDLLRHQGGFPAEAKYCNLYFDAVSRQVGEQYENILYAGCAGTEATKEATAEAICKTPLLYEPGSKTVYSDVDYMVLGLVVESITGKDLDEYIKETFCVPMGLNHITYRPLDNGFNKNDCAATELNGNSRDGAVDFPGIRTATIQGEVHDEAAYYSMGGISGHAGLFANASDLARLASVMLTGGYGNTRFFSQNVIDMFTAPKSEDAANWGLGWYREGDDQRSWYFGTETGTGTIGHQGWTGTLVMVDPSKDLVVVYLTNKINSPVTDKEANLNKFDGGYYTASTLGFVPQLISIGMDGEDVSKENIRAQLMDLLEEMTVDSMRLVDNARANDPGYSRVRNVISKLEVYEKKARKLKDDEYVERAEELNDRWEQYKKAAAHTPEAVLYNMTTEEKIEQMIMPDVRYWQDDDMQEKAGVTELNDEYIRELSEHDFAGHILYAQNYSSASQVSELISEINKCSKKGKNRISPFISIDQEGGSVTRLATGTQLPGNMALGATGDPEAAYEEGRIIGEELAALGINLDFAPVVDVNNNPSNPIIGIRSFSDDPEVVGKMAKGYIDGLHEAGTMATVKHYPGHGDTDVDSHSGLPCIDKSYEELNEVELVPYREIFSDDAVSGQAEAGKPDMVMTAHIQYPQIEKGTCRSMNDGSEMTLPATMSKVMLTDILRNDIGYDGVIISDSMDMGAIADNIDKRDAARLGINAGIDILLTPVDMHSPEHITEMESYIDDLVSMVEDGRISKARVDESVLRILKLKEKYGLLDDVYGEDQTKEDNELSIIGSKDHHDREWELACRAVTLVKNEDNILPLGDDNRVSVICPYDSQVLSVTYAVNRLKEEGILESAFEADIISAQNMDLSDSGSLAGAVSENTDTVIVISALYSAPELDPDNEKGAYSRAVDVLIEEMHSKDLKGVSGADRKRRVVLLSAQLPYDIARYPEADAILACYNAKGMSSLPGDYSQETSQYGPNVPAAIYTIFGGNKPTGRLPVNIPGLDGKYMYEEKFLYLRGEGIVYEAVH